MHAPTDSETWETLRNRDVRRLNDQLRCVEYRGAQYGKVMSGDEFLRIAELRAAGQRDLLEPQP